MRTGVGFSGSAHAALLVLAAFGLPWPQSADRPPIPVSDVSFVTEADFERAQAAAEAPRAPEAPPVEAAPPAPEPVSEPEEEPEVAEPPADADPQVSSLAPEFDPQSPMTAPTPEIEVAPTTTAPSDAARVVPPLARSAGRIEPEPVPPWPEAARPAEAPTPEVAPTPTPDAPPETPAPEASPEAAPAPDLEAAPAPESLPAAAPQAEPAPALALETSPRPVPRPVDLAQAAPEPEAPPAEALSEPDVAAVIARLRDEVAREQARLQGATPPTPPTEATPPTEPTQAQAEQPEAPATSLPVGPPITNAERDGLRLAVQRCWNVPAGLRDAQALRVVLAAELEANGAVISGSIRLIEPSPAPDARFQQAYEAGRRALIRCSPYNDLPREKFSQWREIEVVFNPEGMVSW